ncbi:MAG TPA: hypothetical protein PKK99_01515 [Bacteroidia bacterium]|nr:hypothetical protein [Bacteroidia bacterium]HNP97699.1 hypothetical protein [Bacteroidia bacterium]
MTTLIALNREQILQWISENKNTQAIQDELQAQGHEPESIESYIREFKKIKYARRQSRGFIFLLVGAFMGFLSCVLSLTNPVPDLYYWILYGVTSISISLLCIGLYLVFE